MQKISVCEEKVMLAIWQCKSEATYKEVQAKVEADFGDRWKGETVCSFINRLKKKGYITTNKRGRYTYYEAVVNFEEYRRMKVDEMIQNLYDGDKLKIVEDLTR